MTETFAQSACQRPFWTTLHGIELRLKIGNLAAQLCGPGLQPDLRISQLHLAHQRPQKAAYLVMSCLFEEFPVLRCATRGVTDVQDPDRPRVDVK